MSIKQAIEALELAIETSYSESTNVTFKAAIAALRSMPEPYAYAVYFPDQPTEELVHDLDELLDDMTNREHTITPLFATPHTAPVPPDWSEVGRLLDAVSAAYAGRYMVGTTNWAAFICRQMKQATPHPAPVPAEPVAWYDVENGQIISAPRWYSDGGRTEAPLYAAPPAAPVLTEAWQPISTAPKDGRTLLLGYFNSHGKWRTMRGRWYSLDTIVEEWEESDLAGEGWYETVVESDDYPNCWWAEPTHWMHLPPPPAAALAGDTGEAR